MNISKKALMSFIVALTSLVAMAQPYYHVMKQDGSNQTEAAVYDSKNYKIRVDMVPSEEKPKDAIGGKITIKIYDCNKSCLKRSFYFTKHGNVYYDNTEKRFYFESGQMDRKGWYGVYRFKDGMVGSNDICEHFKWGRTIGDCIDYSTGTHGTISNSETDFYFANPKNLPKLQEDLGNERWGVLSACEWEYVIDALSETSIVNSVRCLLIDTTPGRSLLRDWHKQTNYPFMSWEQYLKYERQGLVFLPANGYRKDGKIKESGDVGYYWSCTPANSAETWSLGFWSSSKFLDEEFNGRGFTVRLVILAD